MSPEPYSIPHRAHLSWGTVSHPSSASFYSLHYLGVLLWRGSKAAQTRQQGRKAGTLLSWTVAMKLSYVYSGWVAFSDSCSAPAGRQTKSIPYNFLENEVGYDVLILAQQTIIIIFLEGGRELASRQSGRMQTASKTGRQKQRNGH